MPTPLELRLVHMACRQAGLEDAAYRLILRNAAGVESAKQLSQAGFEDVMAILEDSGFRHAGKPVDYWRSKVARRGSIAGERMVWKIMRLVGQGCHYQLPGLCKRVSGDRVERVDRLTPREAYNLIELLKAVNERGSTAIGAAEEASSPAVARSEAGTASGPSLVPASL
ncbi:MAG TPA: phage protein GemA/Gp16 family protein [Phycisphaerae bacterium]|nr:phage protein GemA/Gp16 family protein [Phycisphaerae bacterium]